MEIPLEAFLLLPARDRNRLLLSHDQKMKMLAHLDSGQAEALDWYEKNYDIASAHWDNKKGKIFIGDKEDRICRFCKKSVPDVTFKCEAHAIPNFLGNNFLFSYEECDQCNQVFSKLEDSFAKYMGLGRTLAGIKGKKNIPSYKSSSGRSRIERNTKAFKIFDHVDDSIASLSFDTNSLSLEEVLQPYTPIFIYKCLVKIALSIMGKKDLEKCGLAINWVQNLNDNKFLNLGHLKAFQAFCPGQNPFKTISVFLLKKKDVPAEPVPGYMLALATHNYFFQIVIPGCLNDKDLAEQEVTFYPFPIPSFREQADKVQYAVVDFSSDQIVKNFKRNHTLTFAAIEKNKI